MAENVAAESMSQVAVGSLFNVLINLKTEDLILAYKSASGSTRFGTLPEDKYRPRTEMTVGPYNCPVHVVPP